MDQELVSKLKRLSSAYERYTNFQPEDKTGQIPVPVKPDIPPMVAKFNEDGKEMPPVSFESFRRTQVSGIGGYEWGKWAASSALLSCILIPLIIFGAIYSRSAGDALKTFGIICLCLGIAGYLAIFVGVIGKELFPDIVGRFRSKKTLSVRYKDYCAETEKYNKDLREYYDEKSKYDSDVRKEKKRVEDDRTITKNLYQSDYLSLLSERIIDERYVPALPTIIDLLERGAADTLQQAEKIYDMQNR
jgi:hypothetical protein